MESNLPHNHKEHKQILFLSLALLTVLWAVIIAVNFPWSTSFTGWDNLHPEYNFALNAKRALFGVWQAHQGVGHTGGHGYASTLPHIVMTWLLSLVIPIQFIRASFTFLMLGTGMFGCFYLIQYLLRRAPITTQALGAFAGSLYYLLNFSTVQQFSTELEAFIIHFAAVPWLLQLTLRLMTQWDRATFLWFCIVSIVSTTQGFIPPVFLAYFMGLVICLLVNFLMYPTKRKLKTSLLIVITTLCINAYWAFPAFHFTITSGDRFLQSNNNMLSTQSWIDDNSHYGSLQNLAILKGFPSQAVNTIRDGSTLFVFQEWLDHLDTPLVGILGWVSFTVICIGLLYIIFRLQWHSELWIVVIGILYFSILATQIPGLNKASEIIQSIPIIRQAFRAGFTKLSIMLSLCYSICFGYGVIGVLKLLLHTSRSVKLRSFNRNAGLILVTSSLLAASLIFALPTFQGHLLYSRTKIHVPVAYSQLFTYLTSQPDTGRVMVLPQGDHWGWDAYNWGYTGSGFLWFGIPQPILERAFDVWSPYNENYYWELSYALYSQNAPLLRQILQKYDIRWVLFDPSMIPYTGSKNLFYTQKILQMLTTIPDLRMVKNYRLMNQQSNNMFLYEFSDQTGTSGVKLDNTHDVAGDFTWLQKDQAYNVRSPYTSPEPANTQKANSILYPFRTLFSQRSLGTPGFYLLENNDAIQFSSILKNTSLTDLTLQYDSDDTFFATTGTEPAHVSIAIDREIIASDIPPFQKSSIPLPTSISSQLSILIPKRLIYDSEIQKGTTPSVHRCDEPSDKGKLSITKKLRNNQLLYELVNTNSSTCYDLNLPNTPHKNGYVLFVDHLHSFGSPLTLEIINNTSSRTDTTIYLDDSKDVQTSHVFIPPMESDGVGYSLRISNNSKTARPSSNQIGHLSLYEIPFEFLTSMHISDSSVLSDDQRGVSHITVTHSNPALYQVQIAHSPNSPTLQVSESYDDGWIAFALKKQFPYISPVGTHVLVDNWKNGWKLDNMGYDASRHNIYIFFWPQLLEWLGFALVPIPFLLIRRLK